jgi:thiol-disulfide isomerase/thioredoxin
VSAERALRSIAHRVAGDSRTLPDEGSLAPFDRATSWINSPPLTPAELAGKVVLVDFWTYTCVNWLRTLPYLRAWNEKYADAGLTIVGVHTPEFGFEGDIENVKLHARELGVEYPVAVDTHYGVWEAFSNHYWPAVYLADAHGRIRYHHFGEGEYEMTEMAIQQLLVEAGAKDVDAGLVGVHPDGLEVAADWASLRSPETYTGYGQSNGFVSEDPGFFDHAHTYRRTGDPPLNSWDLSGDWTVARTAAILNEAGGSIAFSFQARDANLVMAPASASDPIPFRVSLNGRAPGEAHGSDVDSSGRGVLDSPNTYQLVRQRGSITEAVVEIEFLERGAQAYCFTFG